MEELMGIYLDRYLEGQCEEVWAELLGKGDQVRSEPLSSEARDVARETMRRARKNIEILIPRLISIGYEFWHPVTIPNLKDPLNEIAVYVPPLPDVLDRIAEVENTVGVLPLSLRAWYEIVGTVNFMGNHPDWTGHYYDPLVIDPVESILSEYKNWQELIEEYGPGEIEYTNWQEYMEVEEYRSNLNECFFAPIAPDIHHKAGVSGGSPYSIMLPNPSIDCLVHDDKAAKYHITLVRTLRSCFRYGGFGGLESEDADKIPEDHIKHLTEDLLPI